jgi:prephenate dehydratase
VLSKLQSFPIPDSVWKYFFYADLEFESADHFYSMIEAVKPLTREIELFGLYNKGLTIGDSQ